ncbi:MAG: hypothetical protein K2O42_01725 [Oscillospiraceae bacterium]|nr:hypothetical protein [Oscillospiraceae bacterium]
MKKVISLLSALAVLVCGCPVSASAYPIYNDVENFSYTETGCPWRLFSSPAGYKFENLNWIRNYDFLVVTDAEGLPDDCTDDTYIYVAEWSDYEQYVAQNASDVPSGVHLDNSAEMIQKYGKDARYYYVNLKTACHTPYTSARQFAEKSEHVMDILMLEQQMQGDCCWNGTYTIRFRGEETDRIVQLGFDSLNDLTDEELLLEYPELYTEDNVFNQSKAKYKEWIENYTAWIREHGEDSLKTFESLQEMQLAGIATERSMLQYAVSVASDFYAEYQDKYEACYPNITKENVLKVYRAFSPWDSLGDLDDDGQITAADATSVLNISSKIGAGNDSGLDQDAQQFADVNADGVVNAEDVSLILIYSARKGAGEDISLLDVCKNK